MPQSARRYLIAIVLVAACAAGAQGLKATRFVPTAWKPDFSRMPLQVGEWRGSELPVNQEVYNYLGASAMIERAYEGPTGKVSAIVLYAANWRSLHSPAGCFPAQGWQIVSEEEVTWPAPAGSPIQEPVRARLMRLHKGEVWLLTLFSLVYRGGSTSSLARQAWNVAWGPGEGGVNIQLSTMMEESGEAAARERLRQVFLGLYPTAISFWFEEPHAAG